MHCEKNFRAKKAVRRLVYLGKGGFALPFVLAWSRGQVHHSSKRSPTRAAADQSVSANLPMQLTEPSSGKKRRRSTYRRRGWRGLGDRKKKWFDRTLCHNATNCSSIAKMKLWSNTKMFQIVFRISVRFPKTYTRVRKLLGLCHHWGPPLPEDTTAVFSASAAGIQKGRGRKLGWPNENLDILPQGSFGKSEIMSPKGNYSIF